MPFTVEQDKFILEAYFRNGQKDVDGNWKYSVRLRVEEYQTHFQNIELDDDVLCRHIRRIVSRFHKHGSVCKGKSTGRTTVVEDITVVQELLPLDFQKRLQYLTPLDYLKNQIYKTRLHTIDELKNAITDAIQNITAQLINMKHRVDACNANNGGHLKCFYR
ncbi:hypothetical protein FQA39_LY16781 [Lamprigera yunnana]|nr:hypothetical protein FQA39_LY16781 [Lamprigera yunnana]